ncbi:MAG: substrate-binding domain-containing protein [Bacteroidetes bacterium]|nr:substrate-binding domain-containing protein [Bacteroidota bacterium]
MSCNSNQGTEKPESLNVDTTTVENKINLTNIKVGYCTPSLNAPFYVVLSQYIQQSAEGFGMKFVSADGQDDIIKQITSVEDLTAAGVNVLILNPLDHKALVPAVNAAVKSGVKVFIVDSYIDPTANYITSIQANNEGNGELIGEWIVNKMGKTKIRAALISGSQGNPIGKEKRLGFIRGFSETQLMSQGNADLTIVAQGWGNWTNNGGLKAMEDILVANPDINLLVAENDAMGIGALKAINESGKEADITVVGFDGQKEAYELIKEGKFGATAINSPEELARLVVESVVKYLNGEKQIDKVIFTPAVLVTKDNVDKYYDPKAIF